jgi:hypothetical protein
MTHESIPLTQYAREHGRAQRTVRQMAANGGFSTARKLGRDWIIDKDEPYPDRRKRQSK